MRSYESQWRDICWQQRQYLGVAHGSPARSFHTLYANTPCSKCANFISSQKFLSRRRGQTVEMKAAAFGLLFSLLRHDRNAPQWVQRRPLMKERAMNSQNELPHFPTPVIKEVSSFWLNLLTIFTSLPLGTNKSSGKDSEFSNLP